MVRTKARRKLISSHPLSSGAILQRKCKACSQHMLGARSCAKCSDKQPSQSQQLDSASNLDQDFSQIPMSSDDLLSIQQKLKVGQPNDKYEEEADRVAEQVMQMPESKVQRQVEEEEEEEEEQEGLVQTKPLVQRKVAASGNGTVGSSIVENVIHSSGKPLDQSTRTFMESRFNKDFSQVRVHVNSQAAKSAEAIGARAYTSGPNIVFGSNYYAPATIKGQRLLAHELTHVLQQTGNSSKVDETQWIQRANGDVCEPENNQTAQDPVYDYEAQVCRPSEPGELGVNVPASNSVDSEFWIIPPNTHQGLKPIYDEENTRVIVGFKYGSGGYYEIYDLTGKRVETGEPGLESPIIDPIDLLAGGLTGLGRGLLRGGGRALVRGATGGAGRGTASSLAGAGAAVAIKTISRRAATAIRGA
ncbi:MAG: DUF4157 domain-containing protein, partial [Bacteroidota bacterium]